MYILDEPSIGLHPKDTAKLVEALHHLRDLGNTVIVIEHEEEIIKNADEIFDIGPGAGIHGGTVVYSGSYKEFLNQKTKNLTASYITGINKIPIPLIRKTNSDQIILEDINLHNLQNLKVHFPLQCMICVSGVSGSGKTSLIKHVFHPLLQAKLTDDFQEDQNLGKLSGAYKRIKQVELVNQQAIGRSSRSNPATYVKAYDEIRDIFKQTAENYPETTFYKTEDLITQLGIGEALVTLLNEKGIPSPLVHCMIRPPQSRMDILTDTEIDQLLSHSKIAAKYNELIDSKSAYEILTAKLEEAAQKEQEEQTEKEERTEKKTTVKKEKSIFDDPTVKSMTRTAGNTIVRTLLGVLGLGGRSRKKSLF